MAERLVLRHHSAVGLVDRAAAAGLVERRRDPDNPSTVRVALTRSGHDKLEALADVHREQIAHLAPTLAALWAALERVPGMGPHPARPPGESPATN